MYYISKLISSVGIVPLILAGINYISIVYHFIKFASANSSQLNLQHTIHFSSGLR